MKIALVGNPNCGKTTLYNYLTNNNQKVGNWPGVTVEYKIASYFNNDEIKIVDLPGLYSLTPYTPEEIVTREYLLSEDVDVIINIVDATNLERSLYLTAQLSRMDIPFIIALNMADILKDEIDINKLSEAFDAPALFISALNKTNIDKLLDISTNHRKISKKANIFEDRVNLSINDIKSFIKVDKNKDWYAIKLLEDDEKVSQEFNLKTEEKSIIKILRAQLEAKYNDDINGLLINQTYNFVTNLRNRIIIKEDKKESMTSKIDKIVTNKYLAFPILAIVMFSLYYLTISSVGGFFTEFMEETLFPLYIMEPLSSLLQSLNVSLVLQSLILDGLISGIGAVLTFVPQIMILFFLIAILEDIGYMSRIAFILDKIFTKFGLSGTSVIPMIIGTGCSVPGIMATRTIEDEGNRRLTIMLTPFIICSAKLPIFVLLIGVFFPKSPWLLVAMYFLGIIVILLSGLILKNFKAFKSDNSSFIMELVNYRKPSIKAALKNSYRNGSSFIKNAGTIIFVASAVIWFLSSFNLKLQFVAIEDSLLAAAGSFIAPIFIPLGFGNWEATVATFTGFLAKETVVSTFSILANSSVPAKSLHEFLPSILTQAGALSMMVFTLFAAPCSAAVAATKREMKSWKWTFITIGFQTGVAYILAFIVYNIAKLFI